MNRARRRSCQLLVDDRARQVRKRTVVRFWYADRPDLTDPRAERRVLGELWTGGRRSTAFYVWSSCWSSEMAL